MKKTWNTEHSKAVCVCHSGRALAIKEINKFYEENSDIDTNTFYFYDELNINSQKHVIANAHTMINSALKNKTLIVGTWNVILNACLRNKQKHECK